MTVLNPALYSLYPALQQSFIDKDSGELLVNGTITFYSDINRTALKPVFYINGGGPSPDPYTLAEFPNPLTLSSIGTVVDPIGNPVEIYYSPYDGNGQIENYYIVVKNADDVQQLAIENYPGIGESNANSSVVEDNYIVNGQFLLHNDIAATNTELSGFISASDTLIAPGGHHFVKDGTSVTAKQYVTFFEDSSTTPDINYTFPRFYAEFQQSGSGFDGTRCAYTFRFPNVNMFSTDNTNPIQYTLIFNAYSLAGNVQVSVGYYKYFGANGSAGPGPFIQEQVTIEVSNQQFNIPFNPIPTNELYTIDPNGGDYIEFFIDFGSNIPFDCRVSSICLTKGVEPQGTYPVTSKQEDTYGALAGGSPFVDPLNPASDIYNGNLIGLPVIYGKSGWEPNVSAVGQPVFFSYQVPNWTITPYLFADGTSYQVSLTSSFGIPYARLATFLWKSSINAYLYGTGYEFFSSSVPSSDNNILLTNNTFGSVSPASAGTSGFSVSIVATSTVTGYYVRSYLEGSPLTSTDLFYVENINVGSVDADPSAVNSGFTVDLINSAEETAGSVVTDSPRQLFSVQTVAASALAVPSGEGKYFTFKSYSSGIFPIFVWFQITNETAPAPAGYTNGIKVNLVSTDTATVVAQKIIAALIGGQVSLIGCTAGSAITTGFYFTATSTGDIYNFYYTVNSDTPVVPGVPGINVPINILSADTNSEVATKTMMAINKFMIGVPDWRGMFFRGWDAGRGLDPDAASRYSLVPYYGADNVGTFQYDQLMQHTHLQLGDSTAQQQNQTDRYCVQEGNSYVEATGGSESRPYNASVAIGIIY